MRRELALCAICVAEVHRDELVQVDLDGDGVIFRICPACNDEHPRSGRYAFSDGNRTREPQTMTVSAGNYAHPKTGRVNRGGPDRG